jgi:signal transduction histidine kinase
MKDDKTFNSSCRWRWRNAIAPVCICIAVIATWSILAFSSAAVAAPDTPPVELPVLLLDDAAAAKAGDDFQLICCTGGAPAFSVTPTRMLQTRYGGGSIWLRLSALPEPGVIVLDTMVDVAELYVRDPATGEIRISRAGDTLPIDVREVVAPKIAFPIRDADIGKDYYLRIVQKTRVSVRFYFYKTAAFDREIDVSNLWRALFLGAILVMVLYNTIVSYIVRDVAFLFNAGSIFGLLILDVYLTGVGAAYLWGNFPWASNFVLVLSLGMAIICGGLFIYYFLSDGGAPAAQPSRLLLVAPLLALPAVSSGVFFPYWIVQLQLLFLAGATLLFFIGAVLIRAWRGDIRARIMLMPLGVAMVPGTILVTAQRVFGVELPFVRDHLLEVVLFLEAMLFSFALAYRVRLARDQTAQAHRAYVALEREGNARLLHAIDHERSRIAAELHDTAGQGLLAISNRLSRLAHDAELPPSLQTEMAESEEFSRAIVDDIRRISHDLHPATLAHLGLRQALGQLVRQLKDNTPIDARLEYNLDGTTISSAETIHLFRIVQELITNVAKHSDARRCIVRLTETDGYINLEVGDDGKGPPAAETSQENGPAHLGLNVVRQRVQALSGSLTISAAAPGMRVYVAFPTGYRRGASS